MEAIGAGVDDFVVGDRVFGVIMKPELSKTLSVSSVATPAAFTAKVPEGLDIATAGVLGLAGTAAHDAVEAVRARYSRATPCSSPPRPAAWASSPSSC